MQVLGNTSTQLMTDQATGMQYIAVFRNIPFWSNPWTAVMIGLCLALIALGAWHWFRVSCRNRTVVQVHLPDKKLQVKWFSKFAGDTFRLPTYERDNDGKIVYFTYHFRPECLESGFFGNYIDYDYKILEPLDPANRRKLYGNLPEIFKFVSGLLDTDLAVDLLLSNKFKDFVKLMLTIAVIGIGIAVILSGINTYLIASASKKVVICSLDMSNSTINAIQTAIRTMG